MTCYQCNSDSNEQLLSFHVVIKVIVSAFTKLKCYLVIRVMVHHGVYTT